MKVMIALAETDEGDQPAVAAAVLCAVGLCSHHVTEGIDRAGGVQDHEHPEEPAQQEGADAALPASVPDTKEERKQQSRDHDGPVIAILPHHDRIASQTNFVLRRAIGGVIEEPATVAVPESLFGIVRILFLIRFGVMPDMVGAP